MADLISMLAAVAGSGGGADPNFNQTVLLLHGDGTNGAQNNTFLDSSTNNFTITRNGNTTQGTFSPFSGPNGYWSNYLDGTDDYLSVADNAVLRPGAGAFTLEAWIYRNVSGAAHTVYAKGGASTGIVLQVTSGNVLRFTHTTTNIDSTGTVAANAWVHVAVVREGTGTNQTKLYINGVQDGQGTVSTDFTQTEEVRIGTNRGATEDFAGYISNVRFVKGSALYTAGFTPSTVPLTTTSQGAVSSEVELLTCQSNRFVDNSTNAFAITRNGDVRVTPFSPFAPTAAYSAGTNGGSGYFDGFSDFLTTPNNSAFAFGTGDFTIEAWVYLTGASPSNVAHTIFATRTDDINFTNAFSFAISSANRFPFFYTNAYIASGATGSVQYNSWNHLAVCRSGSSLAIYVNGVSVATATNTQDLTLSVATIGCLASGDEDLLGYISNLRVIKGQALTTGAFTSPTSLVTDSAVGWTGANVAASITGTVSCLLNFTNAGILDNTGKNNLETVADAQIDTTTKKYGTGSMKFDGTGDYLLLPDSENWDLLTSNFTIEFWYNPNSLASFHVLLQQAVNTSERWILYWSATNGMVFDSIVTTLVVSVSQGSTSGWSTGNWYHVALVRNGSNFTIYRNGTSIATTTSSASIPANAGRLFIGGGNLSGDASLNGYIDDLRITKGVARYPTEPFPTAAFPNE